MYWESKSGRYSSHRSHTEEKKKVRIESVQSIQINIYKKTKVLFFISHFDLTTAVQR